MEEFVKVTFATKRKVYVDGRASGFTNKVFQVETGHHTFDLGPKQNYKPTQHDENVTGTLATQPMIIAFERIED